MIQFYDFSFCNNLKNDLFIQFAQKWDQPLLRNLFHNVPKIDLYDWLHCLFDYGWSIFLTEPIFIGTDFEARFLSERISITQRGFLPIEWWASKICDWCDCQIKSGVPLKLKRNKRTEKTFSCKETFISHTFVNDLEHEDKACGLRWIDIFVQNWVPSITRRNLQCGSAPNNEVKNANQRLKRC